MEELEERSKALIFFRILIDVNKEGESNLKYASNKSIRW